MTRRRDPAGHNQRKKAEQNIIQFSTVLVFDCPSMAWRRCNYDLFLGHKTVLPLSLGVKVKVQGQGPKIKVELEVKGKKWD